MGSLPRVQWGGVPLKGQLDGKKGRVWHPIRDECPLTGEQSEPLLAHP